MNIDKARECLHKQVNVAKHEDLMSTVDVGIPICSWRECLEDCAEDYDEYKVSWAIMSYVEQIVGTFEYELLRDLEHVWTYRKRIKNDFIDEYDKVFAFLLSNDAFDKVIVEAIYGDFVKFKHNFNDCLMKWVCSEQF